MELRADDLTTADFWYKTLDESIQQFVEAATHVSSVKKRKKDKKKKKNKKKEKRDEKMSFASKLKMVSALFSFSAPLMNKQDFLHISKKYLQFRCTTPIASRACYPFIL